LGIERQRDICSNVIVFGSTSPHMSRTETRLARVRRHQQGQWRKAEEIYGAILEAAPDHLGALCGLGAIRGQQGKVEDAIQLYRRAASAAPRFADAQMKLGVILGALNHPNDALPRGAGHPPEPHRRAQ
jgi:protein O-GlcNAc transferase